MKVCDLKIKRRGMQLNLNVKVNLETCPHTFTFFALLLHSCLKIESKSSYQLAYM